MPMCYGTKDADVANYMFSARLYFESKNIQYGDQSSQQRPLALLVANLKGPAAAWYREVADERKNVACLEDYVSSFRNIICKVEDMSDIDKVMHFQKGLSVEIRQEVKLRQFRNTTDAISFALMYDRTHSVASVEEPTPMEIGSSWFVSRDECMRNSLCFYCKEPGHRLSSCPKRQGRNASHEGDDDSSDEVEVMQSMQLNMVAARLNDSVSSSQGLLRLDGVMNEQPVRILIDSGAEQNVVRPGLARHVVDAAKVTAERFDGSTTPTRVAQRCLESLTFAGRAFSDVPLIEWEVY
ncbi:uncharacterized protein PITG_05996 [Phytophthora infestans T30-4]|uniref:CCHC-type domain-containing protein n=1 Tax=Phytophthora infestans (strain T30-4) TaxID=403677 RepID=D0N665_PHYIT|nr:uncharacterized protein PITG_05996 [Phytophthora infestans T30-4]EEY70556.1 hypothetical protein PITG_05996 [Phytophthora infestans T30-4]|eukprot:XP_002998210.1 hypothetical protein PITG_05996 [Phytophthora infestans T30-4]